MFPHHQNQTEKKQKVKNREPHCRISGNRIGRIASHTVETETTGEWSSTLFQELNIYFFFQNVFKMSAVSLFNTFFFHGYL